MIIKGTASEVANRLVIFGLWNCIRGYFYGIWLRLSGGLIRQKPLRSVEMVAYNVFQNPHVLVLDSIYREIGMGVYQGETVIIREGVTQSQPLRRWVIYKLPNHGQSKLEQDLLYTACKVAQNILTERGSELVKMDWQSSHESLSKKDDCKCPSHGCQLYSPAACGELYVNPTENVVYQILLRCPRFKSYINENDKSTKSK